MRKIVRDTEEKGDLRIRKNKRKTLGEAEEIQTTKPHLLSIDTPTLKFFLFKKFQTARKLNTE